MAGLFTTLRVRDGRAMFWDDHLRRLREGAAALGLAPAPADLAALVAAAVGDLADARVRVTLAAHGPPRAEARAYEDPAAPWALRPVPVSPSGDGPLLKTTDRSCYDEARAAAAGLDDALLVDASGSWLECSVANVFLRMPDGRLLTPAASLPLLPGVARAHVLAAAAELGLAPQEAVFGAGTAREAVECVVTNALFVAHPVAAVEGVARYEDAGLARGLIEVVRRRDPETRII
jgi:branched-subunit amino acid aminotransferase/4-amino-4-deoxychorismate lyase